MTTNRASQLLQSKNIKGNGFALHCGVLINLKNTLTIAEYLLYPAQDTHFNISIAVELSSTRLPTKRKWLIPLLCYQLLLPNLRFLEIQLQDFCLSENPDKTEIIKK